VIFNAVRLISTAAAVAGIAMFCGQAKTHEPLVVTAARPAAPARDRLGPFIRARHAALIVTVTEYVPAARGTVSVVFGLRNTRDGSTREAGRFAVFPDQAFRAANADEVQRFRIALTKDDLKLVENPDVQLVVSLEATGGVGENARVTIDSIRWDE
jgi:hypothetical protein